MRINIAKKLIGATLVGLVVFSCKKSFLERLPEAALTETNLANTKGVNTMLIAAYAALDGWTDNGGGNAAGNAWPTAGSNWIWGSVSTDDATPGSQPNDQIAVERINRYQYQPDDPYFRAKYQAVYWGVGRANITLRLIAKATDLTPAAKDQLVAEAKFLRAYFHFDGYKMWKNIPYVDETVTTEFRLPNTTDVFPRIETDLKDAIAKLPLVSSSSSGRTNKGAAEALLARAYMFVGRYADAKPLLADIIGSTKYSLVNNFHDNFDAAKQNNSEMVFSYKASVNDGAPESANGNWADRLEGVHNMTGVNGCCGFHTASQNLVNAYKTDPVTGLPMANFNAADYNVASDYLDPRIDFTFARPGIPFFDWGPHQAGWARDVSYSGYYNPKKTTFHKGQYKTLSTASGWSDWPNAIDIPIIRYADVLLMAAECEVETNGDLLKARDWINAIRTRATNFVQGGGGTLVFVPGSTPPKGSWSFTGSEAAISVAGGANFSITRASGPKVPDLNNGVDSITTRYKVGLYPAFAGQAAARDAVRWERRLELAMEGYRYFDLVRWNVATAVLNAYTAVEKTKFGCYVGVEQFDDHKKLYPIPSVEIELSRIGNVAQLKQNPGY